MKYDARLLKIKQLHFGVGRFHKAHQAFYNHRMLEAGLTQDWGLASMSLRSPDASDSLRIAGCQYHLMMASASGAKIEKIGSIRETLFPLKMRGRERMQDIFKSNDLRLVTLTITEKGYLSTEPDSAISLLYDGLERRRKVDGAPLTIISCDNLSKNGDLLKSKVYSLASSEMLSWLEKNVSFPNSMVDRIVPETTSEHRQAFKKITGSDDSELVATEEFTQWIIEDKFAGEKPPLEKVGVELVADVLPYEKMKLRLLNAAHSFLAYAGQLEGYQYVHHAIDDPVLNKTVRALWNETLQVVPLPKEKLQSYCERLQNRFRNPFLMHSLKQIAMDGSQKIPIRIIESIRESALRGETVEARSKVVNAWLRYITHYASRNWAHLDGQDPLFTAVPELKTARSTEHTLEILTNKTQMFAPLAEFPRILSSFASN
jgi:fructuronate reductase